MRAVPRRLMLGVLAVVAVACLAVNGVSSPPAVASGPSAGFDAGNIIDDALFYDGNAMTAGEVQTFLNQQVPQCWLGRPGYEVGKIVTWGGVQTGLASKCTKDYVTATQSRAANAHCSAYVGGPNESAAQIIAKVGKACGISQRVLLITLQKEQSLITDPWPNNEQYFRAMGYACPDSGPGGTANCDPTLGGFYQQVYRAAWQLKVYKAFSGSYNYKPFQNNYVQWHPNASCGGSTVYIKNWATAALYIYTPYRPNQAALNAGWGTGDGCSSYGNRNFYNFYVSWWGSPVAGGYVVHDTLKSFYESNGGSSGRFGAVTGAPQPVRGGIEQQFAAGYLYWHAQTGALAVVTGFVPGYRAEGGAAGYLGLPLANEYAIPGGARQEFQAGTGYWSAGTGAVFTNGAIRTLHMSEGGTSGYMGFPRTAESRASGNATQEFQGATAYYTPGTGASVVNGAIRGLYLSEGGPLGYLGYPIGVELRENGAARQEFQRGTAYYTPQTGASVINGAIRTLYYSEGGPSGYLGYPVGPEVRENGSARQEFQGGTAYYTNQTGASVINGAIRGLYLSEGGPSGYLGYPVGPEVRENGAARQEFERGTAYYTPQTGASVINGAIRAWYVEHGGPKGQLGYPIGPELRANGKSVQRFQGGALTWTPSGGVVATFTQRTAAE